MQIQRIITDGISKAQITFSKEGKVINGFNIKFDNVTPKFQMKVGQEVDKFIKTLDKN